MPVLLTLQTSCRFGALLAKPGFFGHNKAGSFFTKKFHLQNENAMFPDTIYEETDIPIELLRKMSTSERIAIMRSLTSALISRSRQEIADANPGLTPEEVNLRWVGHAYGKELEMKLRNFLEDRRKEAFSTDVRLP